ncbi:MAG: nicotinate-nucleotide diphosphorylase (carboxylating), partial [Comamonas sp.]
MSIIETAALPVPPLPDVMLEPLVRMALLEDLGRAGDLTTDTIVPAGASDELRLMARQHGVLAGLDLARLAFTLMDGRMEFQVSRQDGTVLEPGMEIARIRGKSRAILTAERPARTSRCPLSGVAAAP